MKKFFVFSLVALSVIFLNIAVSFAAGLQDFEEDNGTPDDYFFEVWNCEPLFDEETVHAGDTSLRVEVFEDGGTVGINVANEDGYVDLSRANKISIWVYDTQGNNTIELRLKDIDGNGGSGGDGNALWSQKKARKNKWAKVEWDLSLYPEVEDLDLTSIATLELFEYNEGIYYFDDLEFE